MQLTKAQRGVVLAVAVVLLAVGLAPWPGDNAPPAEQGSDGVKPRRVCPAGFALGDDDTLPAGHPAVPGVGDGSGASALTFDVPAPLEPVTGARPREEVASRASPCVSRARASASRCHAALRCAPALRCRAAARR